MDIRYFIKGEDGFLSGSFACPQSFPTVELDNDIVKMLKKPRIVNNKLVEGKTAEEETAEKLTKLREIRDGLLFQTVTRIQQQYRCEQDDVALNNNSSGKITTAKYKEWLMYWRDLRDLPESVDVDLYTLENLETAFPTQPE